MKSIKGFVFFGVLGSTLLSQTATAANHYLNISPTTCASYQVYSGANSSALQVGGYGVQPNSGLISSVAGDVFYYFCAVNVPQGATITRLAIYGGGKGTAAYLYGNRYSNGNKFTAPSASVLNTTGTTFISANASLKVDNENYSYVVTVTSIGMNGNVGYVNNVEVMYTY